jgi:O-succinylbenzoate synthase
MRKLSSIIKLYHHPYELISKKGPLRQGALLKVIFDDGTLGYADCHPWSNLGDLPLEGQLDALKQNRLTSLTRCSLNFASLDAQARAEQRSLFDGLLIPPNHYLIQYLDGESAKEVDDAITEGFTIIKIKIKNGVEDVKIINKLIERSPKNIRFRFDFNAKLSYEAFKAFSEAIITDVNSVDFYEDPIPYDKKIWQSLQENEQLTLACDREAETAMGHAASAQVLVIKPAVIEPKVFETSHRMQKLVFTSYLDHPLGQTAAAYSAAKAGQTQKIETCGLLSHVVYHPTPFSECISATGPHFRLPPGTGFGFDSLLQNIQWKCLL